MLDLLSLSPVLSRMQGNPKLATLKDDDERLPIHWAVSYNHRPIVEIFISRRDFDPDVQDASGWTPLMIASSLREEDGLVDMLLRKDADVNIKNNLGQVRIFSSETKSKMTVHQSQSSVLPSHSTPKTRHRQPSTSQPLKTTSTQLKSSSPMVLRPE